MSQREVEKILREADKPLTIGEIADRGDLLYVTAQHNVQSLSKWNTIDFYKDGNVKKWYIKGDEKDEVE